MATRNLRIEPTQLAPAGGNRNNTSNGRAVTAAPFRHLSAAALFSIGVRAVLIATSLGVVMAAYSVLSSPAISYFLALALAVGSGITAAAMRPDKLAPVFALICALLALLIVGYHVGLFPIRVFLLLSGLVGVVCALSLAVLSVFSGTHVSEKCQVACFVVSLVGVAVGSAAQLLLLGRTSHIFLYGLELSVVSSVVNLALNKRTSAASGNGFTAAESGGFIPGRDTMPLSHDRDRPEMTPVATPLSPALQFQRRL